MKIKLMRHTFTEHFQHHRGLYIYGFSIKVSTVSQFNLTLTLGDGNHNSPHFTKGETTRGEVTCVRSPSSK